MNPSVIKSDLLKEELYMKEYPCGLKAFIIPKKGYSKKYAMFSTNFGSIDSKFNLYGKGEIIEVPDGVAHFLEHKLFEQTDGNAMEMFADMGVSSNAFTSFNQTSYLFSCTDKFEEAFELLLRFVQNPDISEESVEKEKGIIGQEIRMYEDDPDWRLYFNLIGALYNDFPVRKDIAGTIESISHINRDVLYKCFNTFYHLSNMAILVVGDVDIDKTFEIIENKVDINKEKIHIDRGYPEEENKINEARVEVNLDVHNPLFMIGFKNNSEAKNDIRKEISINIALETLLGRGSEAYIDMYESGLLTSILDVDCTFEKYYSFVSISGESQKYDEVIDRVMNVVEIAKETGINEEDFLRVKKKFLGEALRQFNSVEKIAHSFMSNYFRGVNIFEYVETYEKITIEDVNNAIRDLIKKENMAVSIVKPY